MLSNSSDAYHSFIRALKLKNNSRAVRDRFYPKHNIEEIYNFVMQYSIDNGIFNEDLFEIIQIYLIRVCSLNLNFLFFFLFLSFLN